MNPIGTVDLLVTFFKRNIAMIPVPLYDGKTLEECIRMKDNIIDGYFLGNEYHSM